MTTDQRVDELERDISEIKSSVLRIEGRIDRIENRLWDIVKWGMGVILTMWVTIILAIIFT